MVELQFHALSVLTIWQVKPFLASGDTSTSKTYRPVCSSSFSSIRGSGAGGNVTGEIAADPCGRVDRTEHLQRPLSKPFPGSKK